MSKTWSFCCAALGEALLRGYRVLRLQGQRDQLREERCGGGAWPAIYEALAKGESRMPRIWLHCASVGEVRGILPLLPELQERGELIGTICTMTGKHELSKHLRHVALLPFDAPSLLRRHMRALQADLLVINETELWPNLLSVAAEHQLPVLLINGRISDRSFPRYRRIAPLCRLMLSQIESVVAQTERDAERFRCLGAAPERVSVAGSTKYDKPESMLSDERRRERRTELGMHPEAPCVIAASVREGEYQQVLEAFAEVKLALPDVQLIIAPRHPEYFEAVAEDLRARAWSFQRRSEGAACAEPVEIVLVDTIGELHRLFPLADVAFIGGTLVPIGGHNPLEAAAAGLPMCLGPSTENVRDLASELCEAGAAFTVRDARGLAAMFVRILSDRGAYDTARQAALHVCAYHRGAVGRILKILDRLPLFFGTSSSGRQPLRQSPHTR